MSPASDLCSFHLCVGVVKIFQHVRWMSQINTHTKCLIKKVLHRSAFIYCTWSQHGWPSEVVDNPADGLNVGVLGLPLVMAAVVSTFHDVHPTSEVWLLVHHPADAKREISSNKPKHVVLLCDIIWNSRAVAVHLDGVDAVLREAAALQERSVVADLHTLTGEVTRLEQLHTIMFSMLMDKDTALMMKPVSQPHPCSWALPPWFYWHQRNCRCQQIWILTVTPEGLIVFSSYTSTF